MRWKLAEALEVQQEAPDVQDLSAWADKPIIKIQSFVKYKTNEQIKMSALLASEPHTVEMATHWLSQAKPPSPVARENKARFSRVRQHPTGWHPGVQTLRTARLGFLEKNKFWPVVGLVRRWT